MKKTILLFISFAACLLAEAQVKSPKEFLGYEIGDKFTPHHKIVGYFEALAKAAPTQMKLEQYGNTNEGRPLMLAFISTAENMANLENIRKNNLQLAGLEAGNGQTNAPAIVWLSYNVHGNEASSSEATMMTTHFLLTDARAKDWLKTAVVVIDPCINPDGRDRYAHWYNSMVGSQMDPEPISREHMEPWPGGRSNHYNFDLNRDWAWQTQVETQQRLVKYNQWMPQVHVDFHEQGYNDPYYFAPAAEPFHEVITPWQRSFQTQIGRNHAKYFDKEGWLYFTKERFDLLYPSYGDTWPTYNGSVGMTYEQGGIRAGLGIRNEDGDTLTLRDRALHHHTTGISTVEISAQNAGALLQNFQQFFSNAKNNGVGEHKSFVVKAKGNEGKIPALLNLLKRNGIDYGYANGGAAKGFNYTSGKEESFNLEKGDLIISTYQPRGTMVKVLFEPTSKLSDSATYDITAWSVPYAHGLQAYAVKEKLASVAGLATPPLAKILPAESYGYLKTWRSIQDARFLAACLRKGIKPRISERAFEVKGVTYPAGTLVFIKTSNRHVPGFDQQIQSLAASHGVELEPVGTGFMDKGADFGSPDVKTILAPKVALITGEGTSSLGAGELWHFFDQDLKYPVSLINLKDAGNVDWKRFDAVIVPDGSNYRSLFDKEGAIKNWVDQGGKLILLENAVAQMARADWGLSAKKAEEDKTKPDDYKLLKKYADRERDNLVYNNPGSIYRVDMDTTHPLAFGYSSTYFTLKSDDNVYDFMKEGWNVGVIKKGGAVAGFSGVEVKKKLVDGVLFGELPMGRGKLLFMADDIVFRNFWENGKLMMANALFMTGR